MLEVGKPLPIDVWSPSGQLLLRRGQVIVSESHKQKLAAHSASAHAEAAQAWQRAYERMVHTRLRDGEDLEAIAALPMPSEILQRDYVTAIQLQGGWLDLQEVLRGILYQGGLAINPLPRLEEIEKKAFGLLQEDADDSLFCLFQALADNALGYCATHALLCAAICALTGPKLGLESLRLHSLVRAAVTMNIGMAREQDRLSRQDGELSDWQRELIRDHAQKSTAILQSLGVDDADHLDIVRWHHDAESADALERNLLSRRLLQMADAFVAKLAARKSRQPVAAVKAVKSIVMGAQGDALGMGSAMAQAVGFYPPGSYVMLANGDTGVSVQRGVRANTPWVIPLLDKDGMPVSRYECLDTTMAAHTIASAVSFEKVRVHVNVEKVRRARDRIPRKNL